MSNEIVLRDADVRVDENPLPIEFRVLSMDILADHIFEFGSGRNKVTGLDAAGIRFVAGIMGLSIEDCEVRESGNGTTLLGKAKAVDPKGRSYFGYSKQDLKMRNGKVDDFAYQKCATKAQRNAFMGLIPAPLINRALQHTQINQMETPLANAKARARQALKDAQREMTAAGLTPEDIFEHAKFIYGDAEEWTIAQWQTFEADLRDFSNSDLIKGLLED